MRSTPDNAVRTCVQENRTPFRRGCGGPGSGHRGKAIVPSSARLKFSFRLVAGQDTARIQQLFTGRAAARPPAGLRHEIRFWGGTRPCLTPLVHPAPRSPVRATGRAFGQEIRFTREGGSGPAADLRDVPGVPVPFLGISVSSDGWHSVNDTVEPDPLFTGVETAAHRWGELAGDWRAEPWQRTTGK